MNSQVLKNEIEKTLGFGLIRRNIRIGEKKVKDEYIKQNLYFRNVGEEKIEEAIKKINEYLSANHPDELLLATLGYLYMHQERYTEAKDCFLKAINQNPDDINNWIDLSDIYELTDKQRIAKIISLKHEEIIGKYTKEIIEDFNESILLGMINLMYGEGEINERKKDICRIVNLDDELISVATPKHKTGKRLLFINPPVEEPFIGQGKASDEFNFNREKIELHTFYCLIDGELYVKRNLTPIEPLALMQVSNALFEKGNEIVFFDCLAVLPEYYQNSRERITASEEPSVQLTQKHYARYFHLGMPYNEIKEKLKKLKGIDEIYISCGLTYHNNISHKLIEICKEVMPDVKVIFGGIYPTLLPDEASKSKADEIYTGKYPCANQRLNYYILGYTPPHMTIKGTSGCNQNCDYCAVKYIEGEKFKFRDPEEIIEEIDFNHKQYGLNKVGIIDSNVLINYDQYCGKLLDSFREKGFRLFSVEGVDYRLLDQNMADDLFKGGFRWMFLALDIFEEPDCVKKTKRANDLNKFSQALEMLKKAGFLGNKSIEVFILIGTPGQTIEETTKIIKYVWSFGVNVNIFCFTPIPGTRMYNDIYNKIKHMEQKELHPALFACADKENIDDFVDIMKLNILAEQDKLQQKTYGELIVSENLKRLLAK